MKKSFLLEGLEIEGDKCQIFSIKFDGEESNEFEKYLLKYETSHKKIINSIVTRLELMKKRNGCLDIFFNLEVSSIYNSLCRLKETKTLRLYCIRFGNVALILGGGGIKPDDIRTYQEVPELNEEVDRLSYVYEKILDKIKEKEIKITNTGLEGDLYIKIEENDE